MQWLTHQINTVVSRGRVKAPNPCLSQSRIWALTYSVVWPLDKTSSSSFLLISFLAVLMIHYERTISLRRRRLERGGKVSCSHGSHSLVGGCPSRLHLNESFESGLKYPPAPSPLPLAVCPQPCQHKWASPGNFSNRTFLELKPHIQRPRVHLVLGNQPLHPSLTISCFWPTCILNKASFGL